MKLRILAAILMAVALALNAVGCNLIAPNQTPQQLVDALAQDVAIVRAVVAAQPAGPQRDKLLKSIDQVTSYATLAEIIAQLATPVPVATQVRVAAATAPSK